MFQTEVLDEIKTHVLYSFFCIENRAVCEIMWKNIVERDRPRVTIWRMRFACWIPKATNTHSEYVLLIAFPLHKFLHERVLMLSKAFSCLVITEMECVYCVVRVQF